MFNFDDNLVKILGLGLVGFAFLALLLSYFLSKEVLKKDDPKESALKSIRQFALISLGAIVAVGVLSLPIWNENAKLKDALQKVDKLEQEREEKTIAYEAKINDLLEENQTLKDKTLKQESDNKKFLSEMKKSIDKNNKELAELKKKAPTQENKAIIQETEKAIAEVKNEIENPENPATTNPATKKALIEKYSKASLQMNKLKYEQAKKENNATNSAIKKIIQPYLKKLK